ncbi:MAG: cation diffusion facilitator family transporter [Ruminococcus sp.]|uniref:cation diffusion facilitator family transporter n=1 Tax=Ruminococcus sp. TaxID=41978 RepID=UPI0025D26C92|nr:cation diffusion facilitator family transporter [Ruminococcus sp.]MCR5602048.1 cation diffusion facilitator family transporter [Ruminococcus sp.]
MEREKVIVKTSMVGIFANIFLASFKAAVGILSSSIAIILDAVNNLSDVMSSVITIIGTKLAEKRPDKKHPYGYGRIENLSTALIAVIVLYAGITSLVESVKKIIHPVKPDYSGAAIAIVASAVVVKILLGLYVKKKGESVSSESLIASGKDALLDSVISIATLIAALIYLTLHIRTEAWLGAVISLVIIKSGLEILGESLSSIIGKRISSELSKAIKETVTSFPEVCGAYDLLLHNYGPDLLIGSVHIEVPDTMTVAELDKLEHRINEKVLEEHRVILAGISVYAVNTQNDKAIGIYEEIRRHVMSHEYVLQIHGFYLDDEKMTIHFDIIIDFAAPDRSGLYDHILTETQEAYPEYSVSITLDTDVSD